MASRILRLTTGLFKASNTAIQQRCLASKAISYKEALLRKPEADVTTLQNGLTVATEDSGSKTCTVGIYINAGSRYEDDKINGVANFVEHMAFKGTGNRSQADLEAEIENMGAYLNSYTTRENTAFYIKCLSKDVGKAVEILSDIVQNTQFGDAPIERERNFILNEMEEAEANKEEVVLDYLHATAYQGTSMARSVLGTPHNIKNMTKKDLVDYVSSHFKGARMVLAGAGGINHKEMVDLANKHLSKVESTYQGKIPMLTPCRYTGSDIRYRDDDMPCGHVAIAVEGCGWSNPDHLVLTLASTILGSWDVTHGGGINNPNPIAQNYIQHKFGHGFQSFNITYKDTGLFGVYYTADKHHLDNVMYNIQIQFGRLSISMTTKEVERAKAQLRTNLARELEGTTPSCDHIGRQFLNHGRHITLNEWDEKIQEINVDKVKDVCYKYIYNKCPVIAAVGPLEHLIEYERYRGNMWWLKV